MNSVGQRLAARRIKGLGWVGSSACAVTVNRCYCRRRSQISEALQGA